MAKPRLCLPFIFSGFALIVVGWIGALVAGFDWNPLGNRLYFIVSIAMLGLLHWLIFGRRNDHPTEEELRQRGAYLEALDRRTPPKGKP